VIVLKDLTYRYRGQEATAVQSVSMEIHPGEIVGVVGPNGSGKSTVGRLAKGLILPDTGEVLVDGVDSSSDPAQARRAVGLVFQNPNGQIVNSAVSHEVAFGLENMGLPSAEISFRVHEALSAVGLEALGDAECHSLSMANKQRVALASVIAMKPQYLILDEATAWVEPGSRWPLLEHVLDWCARNQTGLMLITHRMDEAQICDRVYGMLYGSVEISGSARDVLADKSARDRLALEIPGSIALATALQAEGLPVTPDLPIHRLADALCRS